MKKIDPNKRYRFLTKRECIAKWHHTIPPSWGDSMTRYLGQEVPQSLVYELSRRTDEASILQPNFCWGSDLRTPWYFSREDLVLLEDQESF
jgi:hypothetical protein